MALEMLRRNTIKPLLVWPLSLQKLSSASYTLMRFKSFPIVDASAF